MTPCGTRCHHSASHCEIAIAKSPGMCSIPPYRSWPLSFPECCALSRMCFPGFRCPGGSSGQFTSPGFTEEESAVAANQAHIAGPLCFHQWKSLFCSACPGEPGELVIEGDSAHAGCFLFFRGSMSPKACLKII